MHVLSTPPAFVLSQDQTLHKSYFSEKLKTGKNKRQTNQTQLAWHSYPKKLVHPPRQGEGAGTPNRLKRKSNQKLLALTKSTQNKVHRHTIEFSKNTRTPTTTRHTPSAASSKRRTYHTRNLPHKRRRPECFPLFPQPVARSPCGVGLADHQNITHAASNKAKRQVTPQIRAHDPHPTTTPHPRRRPRAPIPTTRTPRRRRRSRRAHRHPPATPPAPGGCP